MNWSPSVKPSACYGGLPPGPPGLRADMADDAGSARVSQHLAGSVLVGSAPIAYRRISGGCRGTAWPDYPLGRRRVDGEQAGRADGAPD